MLGLKSHVRPVLKVFCFLLFSQHHIAFQGEGKGSGRPLEVAVPRAED